MQEMKRLTYMLNNDISIEVLSRLPVKILHKMKLVCKEWRSMISDHSFVRSLLQRKEPLTGFFFQESHTWVDEDIDRISYLSLETLKVHCSAFDFLPEKVVLLASCNGLVCCRSSFPSSRPLLYVCNPLNREWISLQWIHPSQRANVALDFDPFQVPTGDASVSFKVVAVNQSTNINGESEYSFDVYSSETGDWMRSAARCLCEHHLLSNKGIFVDGYLYWLTDGDAILMFNPEIGFSALIAIPLPLIAFDSKPEMCIGESKGNLHFVFLSGEGLQLWVINDPFTSTWDLCVSISLKELEEVNPMFPFDFSDKMKRHQGDKHFVVHLLAYKDDILFFRLLTSFHSYDFGTRTMRKLCENSQLGQYVMHSPMLLPYSMSLVPPSMM
ncbi:OLC1v1013915C1 [Oldenlandia corymbosa var. corymbosa]|uniref:OLC1v1013915C1 n=1 Tax=Oldenlandia corymbosa var. corymbosa TaxID=529605 RepID=A0AAV1DZI2_OLDCO|nr:OLC1v1013915C1 [Oldenlandia corymbosa var. corymbosa]